MDYLYVGLMVVGLLAGLFLYRAAARWFIGWLLERHGLEEPEEGMEHSHPEIEIRP